MDKARTEGKIQFIGLSSHNNQTAVKACRTGHFDTVQIPFNFIERDEEVRVLRPGDPDRNGPGGHPGPVPILLFALDPQGAGRGVLRVLQHAGQVRRHSWTCADRPRWARCKCAAHAPEAFGVRILKVWAGPGNAANSHILFSQTPVPKYVLVGFRGACWSYSSKKAAKQTAQSLCLTEHILFN